MGGGLMQLVAYGAQDVYLSGNPQITFFKSVYRRHTNFAMEAIEQTFSGAADFGKRVTATISRNGDLITKMYLQVDVPTVRVPNGTAFRWLNWLGLLMIQTLEIEIGGQRIDKHYGEWLYVWNELTQSAGHQVGFANMVGNTSQLTTPLENNTGAEQFMKGTTLFVPLQFWFNRNAGLALPLIALQYHEIRINLEMRPVTDCYWAGKVAGVSTAGAVATAVAAAAAAKTAYDSAVTANNTAPTPTTAAAVANALQAWRQAQDAVNTASLTGASWTTDLSAVSIPQGSLGVKLFVDYIYLDTDERRRFAQVSHEYLVEQLQFTGTEATTTANPKIKLSFNHPVKELIWTVQKDSALLDSSSGGKQWFNYTDGDDLTYSWLNSAAALQPFSGACGLVDPNSHTLLNNQGTAPGVAAGGANGVFLPVSFEGGVNPVVSAKLQLNGHDRFSERPGRYFNLVQPYQHHENIPTCGINVYSFGLKPEEHQPSGSCNMSRIDNATLQLTLTAATVAAGATANIRVYAINYNVLRVMSGMGGLAYSN